MAFNDINIADFEPQSGTGVLMHIGYGDGGARFKSPEMQQAINDFAGSILNQVERSIDYTEKVCIGFNGERVLLNTWIYIAIGAPLKLPENMNISSGVEYWLDVLWKNHREFLGKLAPSCPLRIGISGGTILAFPHNGEIKVVGEPYGNARGLMSLAEDIRAPEHIISIDQSAYEQFDPPTQAKYEGNRRSIPILSFLAPP